MKECTEMSALVREHARAKLRKARKARAPMKDILPTDRPARCQDPSEDDNDPAAKLN